MFSFEGSLPGWANAKTERSQGIPIGGDCMRVGLTLIYEAVPEERR
jgi:hypothetical protein